jgi:hypothetical protein
MTCYNINQIDGGLSVNAVDWSSDIRAQKTDLELFQWSGTTVHRRQPAEEEQIEPIVDDGPQQRCGDR